MSEQAEGTGRVIQNYPFTGEVLVTSIEDFERRYNRGKPLVTHAGGPIVGPKYPPYVTGGTHEQDRSALVVVAVRDPDEPGLESWIDVAVVDLRAGEAVNENWANGPGSTSRYVMAAIALADATVAIEHG